MPDTSIFTVIDIQAPDPLVSVDLRDWEETPLIGLPFSAATDWLGQSPFEGVHPDGTIYMDNPEGHTTIIGDLPTRLNAATAGDDQIAAWYAAAQSTAVTEALIPLGNYSIELMFGDKVAPRLDEFVSMSLGDLVRGPTGAGLTDYDDIFYAGTGRDIVAGGDGDDEIHGEGHRDRIHGEAGDDTLTGGGAKDMLNGGPGNDTLIGQRRDDRLIGEDGDDILRGGAGSDTLRGGKGADRLKGGKGDDGLSAGPGKDILRGHAGDDTLNGRGGNDKLFGGAGDDFLGGQAGDDLLLGGGGNDEIEGGAGVDRIVGMGGNDKVFGEKGDDVILGRAGRDKLIGNAGNDLLLGGVGRDLLRGGKGDDELQGGKGNDILTTQGGGDDLLFGDAGNDSLLTSTKWEGYAQMEGGAGADDFYFLDGGTEDVTARIMDFDPAAGDRLVFKGFGLTPGSASEDLRDAFTVVRGSTPYAEIEIGTLTLIIDGVDSFDDISGFGLA